MLSDAIIAKALLDGMMTTDENIFRNLQQYSIIINSKILKASNVKTTHPVCLHLAESLATIDILNFIKIYNERIKASNLLSENKKKEPITKIGQEGVVGVELLIDQANKTIQFYSLTSSEKGYGRKIVKAVVDAVPDDWSIFVVFDSSGGFWNKMKEEFPRLSVA